MSLFEGAEPELAHHLGASENATFLRELDLKIAEKLTVGLATDHVEIIVAVHLEGSLRNFDRSAKGICLDVTR